MAFKRLWGNDRARETGGRLIFTLDLTEVPPQPEAAEIKAEAPP
jgi:hypothetical protein